MSRPLRALSISQPWAWAILHAGKSVENRTWPTKFRGRILIHAPKTIDREAIEWLKLNGHQVPDELPTGGFVGEVTIGDCYRYEPVPGLRSNPWAFGPYCFTLHLPYHYDQIIPAKGRLGIFKVEVPG